MRQLVKRIEQFANLYTDRESLVSAGAQLSYQTLAQRIHSTRDELQALGIRRLGIYATNSFDWAILDLAASSADIVVVPIPLFFSAHQVEHLMNNSFVDHIFTDRDFPFASGQNLASKTLQGEYVQRNITAPRTLPDYCKVTYTSGSTGQPKGACLGEGTMMSIVTSLSEALIPSQLGRHLALLPFATLLENVAGIYLALWMGRSIFIETPDQLGLSSNHTFDPHMFAGQIKASRAESVILLPQMLKLIVEANVAESLAGLKFMAVGGGKVAPDLLLKAQALGLPVYEGYGLTECGSCVALNTPLANRVGSVGKPLPHAQVRIGDSGEVFVTGAAMTGYLQDMPAPSEIATGDAGFIDTEGFLHITGRIKNVIISSYGRNISPEWVESYFLADTRIQQMAVFGEAQPHLSAVFIVSDALNDRELQELVRTVNEALPDYAKVMAWTRTAKPFSVDQNTLTSNGKMRRDVIAQKYFELAYKGEVAA